VAESKNREDRVTVFDAASGTMVALIGGRSGPEAGQLNCVRGVCFSADGARVVVADSANYRLSVFDAATGVFLRHLGDRLHVRPEGVIGCLGGYVITSQSGRVVCVSEDGEGGSCRRQTL
jgi:DNA-binding beta-propeller fold protein YncE